MNIKQTTALIAMLGALTFAANAQDNNPPPGGLPGMRQGGPNRFHLLPPRAVERLNLTDDQKKQIAALEAETKAKLENILTPEQLKELKAMRPPNMGRGGPGMHRAPGGPGSGDNMPPNGPPPGEGNGNNLPPGNN